MTLRRLLIAACTAALAGLVPAGASAAAPPTDPVPRLLVSGLDGGSGSAIGPGGDLYVTEPVVGRLSRIDRRTGEMTTVATGLPPSLPGAPTGGAMDVAFLGTTPYVLVTLVGPDLGGTDAVGIYRVDGPDDVTLVADIGAYSIAHPPETDFFVPSGVQYALEPYRGGLLVTDGHHNRVLWVSRSGEISQVRTFTDIVPTGLETKAGTVYLAQAGPVPHLPENGVLVRFRPDRPGVEKVASGGRLLVDVEFGRGHALYALAQGFFQPGNPEGSPAQPDTGQLLRVTRDGGFDVVADGLDRPTSMEIVGATAYVITLDGEVWAVDGVAGAPYRGHR
jgi:hypothetical protein